jgi:hypothetical protein
MPDGTYLFRARSFSRKRGQVYRCRVNPVTGYVYCNCKDFMYRHAPFAPSYWGGHVCKHLQRAIRTVRGVERARAHDYAMAA